MIKSKSNAAFLPDYRDYFLVESGSSENWSLKFLVNRLSLKICFGVCKTLQGGITAQLHNAFPISNTGCTEGWISSLGNRVQECCGLLIVLKEENVLHDL